MDLGVPYSYQFRATGGSAPYSYFVYQNTRLPSGLNLSISGEINGYPLTANPSNDFTIIVRDSTAVKIGLCNFQVAVIANRFAITTSALPAASVGVSYSETIQTSGGAAPVRFEILGGTFPPGIQAFANGLIRGTPSTAGTYTMRFRAFDANNNIANKDVTLVVTGPSLRFETTSLPNGEVGLPYSSKLLLSQNPANASFQVFSGQLPPGLSLLPSGSFSGTPSLAGDFVFTIRAAVDSGSVNSPFTIRIANPSRPLTLLDWQPTIRIGLPLSNQIPSAGARSELRFSLLEGVIPAGLTISVSGKISGTPRVSGNFTQRWRATDTSGASAEKSYLLVIEPARAFPAAVAGQRYSQRDNLPGASRYVVDPSNRLPLGLRLEPDGTLTGTPFASGEYLFLLSVELGTAPAQTFPFRIAVVAPSSELELDTLDLPSAIQNRPYRQSFLALPAATNLRLIDGELPPGLILTNNSIEGNPQASGFWEFILNISSGSRSTPRRFAIAVHLAAAPILDAVVNSASYQAGAVAPGEILTLFGANLDGSRATIDGLVAPSLYSTPTQSGIIVPFAAASKVSVELILERNGLQSYPLRLRTAKASPGIYTLDGSGKGPAAALNQDNSLNSRANPALSSSVIVLYATGLGELDAPAIDGATALSASLAKVFRDGLFIATLDGETVSVLYAGAAPGLIHGAAQINLALPPSLSAGLHRIQIEIKDRKSLEVEIWTTSP